MASSSNEHVSGPDPADGGDPGVAASTGASGRKPWRPALVPAPAGRPHRNDVLELILFLIVLGLAFGTPARTDGGEPNAPFMRVLDQTTGGGLCMWKRIFGRPCGGCGLTRGFVQLAHANPIEAVRLNPMTPIAFAWVVWRTLELLAVVFGRRMLLHGIPTAWVWRFYGAFGIGFVVLAIVRLALGVERL